MIAALKPKGFLLSGQTKVHLSAKGFLYVERLFEIIFSTNSVLFYNLNKP